MSILVSILLFYTVIEHSAMVSARGCPGSTCMGGGTARDKTRRHSPALAQCAATPGAANCTAARPPARPRGHISGRQTARRGAGAPADPGALYPGDPASARARRPSKTNLGRPIPCTVTPRGHGDGRLVPTGDPCMSAETSKAENMPCLRPVARSYRCTIPRPGTAMSVSIVDSVRL